MTKIQIHITEDVLERSMWCGIGKVPVSTNCAIAVAIRDIFPNAVIGSFIDFGKEFDQNSIITPKVASDFIDRFDSLLHKPYNRLELPEFSFEIEVPDEVVEMINIDEIKRICETSSTLSLVELDYLTAEEFDLQIP